MNIISPITHSKKVKQIVKIPTILIVDIYKRELDIDVTEYFRRIQYVSIYKCCKTGYKFYYPFNIAGNEYFYDRLKIQLPKLYNSPYYSNEKWEYEIAKRQIRKEDIVLEIGCGNGYFLEMINCKEKTGLELNKESVDFCNKKNLNVYQSTIEEFALNCDHKFDKICFFQVLEHVVDINSFMNSSLKLLNQNGKIIIAVPYSNPYLFKNDKYNALNLPPHHMGLWNKKSFKEMSNFFNLKLEKLIIEKLHPAGYDFDRYFLTNKDKYYPAILPAKRFIDKLFFKLLKKFHHKVRGKNIFVVLSKS